MVHQGLLVPERLEDSRDFVAFRSGSFSQNNVIMNYLNVCFPVCGGFQRVKMVFQVSTILDPKMTWNSFTCLEAISLEIWYN